MGRVGALISSPLTRFSSSIGSEILTPTCALDVLMPHKPQFRETKLTGYRCSFTIFYEAFIFIAEEPLLASTTTWYRSTIQCMSPSNTWWEIYLPSPARSEICLWFEKDMSSNFEVSLRQDQSPFLSTNLKSDISYCHSQRNFPIIWYTPFYRKVFYFY